MYNPCFHESDERELMDFFALTEESILVPLSSYNSRRFLCCIYRVHITSFPCKNGWKYAEFGKNNQGIHRNSFHKSKDIHYDLTSGKTPGFIVDDT